MKKLLSILLALIMLFSFAACSGEKAETATDAVVTTEETLQLTEVGEGSVSFNFTVVDADGNTKSYKVNTDEKTVGGALLAVELIVGEDGPYGLYVKTVDGKTYDYDKDGKYWAFYVDGEMSATGVDMTDVKAGSEYTFKAE